MLPPFPALYPILDASVLPAPGPERTRWLAEAVRGLAEVGVTLLQYRNKDGDDAEVLADAHALREVAPAGLRLILNDRVRLSAASGFDGVHLGLEDAPPDAARGLVGPAKLIGLSTHNPSQIEAGDAEPVDYLAIGPVFATTSKANPDPVVGLEGIRQARALTSKPLVAIGGITPSAAPAVLAAGADAIAVISALFRPGAPAWEAAKLAEDFLRHFRYNTM